MTADRDLAATPKEVTSKEVTPDEGVAFDASVFERAGLLDRSAPDAAEREALLRYLVGLGADLDRIARADATGDLAAVGFDMVLDKGGLSARDLAALAGVTVDQVVSGYHLVGIEVDDLDATVFEAEEAAFVDLMGSVAGVFPDDTTREIMHAVAAALSMLSAAATSAFVGSVEDELAHSVDPVVRARITRGAGELWMELASRLRPLLRHHLRQAVEQQRAGTHRTMDRRTVELAVGFVDLVGYTRLAASMDPSELIAFVGAFRERTQDLVTSSGGRVVKHIGDEIMFSCTDTARACRIALSLIEAFGGEGAAPRGGLAAGHLVARHGDLYGTVVNLASRLADTAVPGELLAPADLTDRLGAVVEEAIGPTPAGRRLLKGFDEPVEVVSFTPAPTAPSAWEPTGR